VVRPRLACAAASPATAFSGTWEAKYPAIVKLWEKRLGRVRALPAVRPGDPHADLHHQRDRVTQCQVPPLGQGPRHFPTEQAALKHLYLVIISLDPTGRGRQRWSNRRKAALNAFDITFDDRLSTGR